MTSSSDRSGPRALEDWQRLDQILDRLFALPADERRSAVPDACEGDQRLISRVERLLDADQSAGGFLQDVVGEAAVGAAESTTSILSTTKSFEARSHAPPAQPQAESAMDVVRRIGKYELLEAVGKGGFGTVFRATDPQLERMVAVKLCHANDPETKARFLKEARLAAKLQHPNIVTVHDFGTIDREGNLCSEDAPGAQPFLIQEFIDGYDLSDALEQKAWPWQRAVRVLEQIAGGLWFAHRQGVVHRDIKPANVRIHQRRDAPHRRDSAKILDFGIAGLAEDDDPVEAGTLGYLAPEVLEQVLSACKPDAREPTLTRAMVTSAAANSGAKASADQFAFGVLAFELLAQRHPFPGLQLHDVLARMRGSRETLEQSLHSLPQQLRALVLRCIEPDPERRFAEMDEVLSQLRAVAGTGASAHAGSKGSSTWSRARAWQVAAAVTVLIASGVWVARWNSSPETGPDEGSAPESIGGSPPVGAPAAPENPSSPRPETGPSTAGATQTEPRTVGPNPAVPREGNQPNSAPASSQEDTEAANSPRAGQPSTRDDISDAERKTDAAKQSIAPPESTAVESAGNLDEAEPHATTALRDVPTGEVDASPVQAPARETDEDPSGQTEGLGMSLDERAPVVPVLVDEPKPSYPPRALRRGASATVVVAVLVHPDGSVQQAFVKSTTNGDLGFNDAALDAARRARYQDRRSNPAAQPQWTELTFDFVPE